MLNEKTMQVLEAMQEKRHELTALEGIINQRWGDFPTGVSIFSGARKAEAQKRVKQIEEASSAARVLKIELKIMHDNARKLIYDAAMPCVIAALVKYNGKPYGEKTREKIANEIAAACGVRAYFRAGYSEDVTLYPVDARNAFSYDDFSVYLQYNVKKEKGELLRDNRINGALALEDFYLFGGRDYVEDPHARALEALEAFEALQEEFKRVEGSAAALNALLPSGVDRVHLSGCRAWLV